MRMFFLKSLEKLERALYYLDLFLVQRALYIYKQRLTRVLDRSPADVKLIFF